MIINLKDNNQLKDKKEEIELIKKAQNNDLEAKNIVTENNLKLVLNCVYYFKGRENVHEDLFQIGTIGLMKAVQKFDADKGFNFSTYATHLILGEMKKFLRDYNTVKISRTIKENSNKVKKAINEYVSLTGEEPNVEMISILTELKEKDVLNALNSSKEVESFSNDLFKESGSNGKKLEDLIEIKEKPIDNWIEKENIKQAFEKLNDKEKEVIQLRFFEEKTQSEIGLKFGISQAHVSRIEKTALKKLKEII